MSTRSVQIKTGQAGTKTPETEKRSTPFPLKRFLRSHTTVDVLSRQYLYSTGDQTLVSFLRMLQVLPSLCHIIPCTTRTHTHLTGRRMRTFERSLSAFRRSPLFRSPATSCFHPSTSDRVRQWRCCRLRCSDDLVFFSSCNLPKAWVESE